MEITYGTRKRPSGFALVVTLTLMILLTMVAVSLLSLSAISQRGSTQGEAQAMAQANAKLALMIALGELQKEMGPDMRVSAESALLTVTCKPRRSTGSPSPAGWPATTPEATGSTPHTARRMTLAA